MKTQQNNILLSPRELKIIALLNAGAHTEDLSIAMCIKQEIVDVYLNMLKAKFHVWNEQELLQYIEHNDDQVDINFYN